jgi:hypothetical protein
VQRSKTLKFVKSLIIFFSIFLAKQARHNTALVSHCARVSPVARVCASRVRLQGVDVVVSLVDASQPGLFGMILEQVWVPNTQKVSGRLERKIVCLGMLKVSPRHGTAVLAVGGASPVLGDVAGASPVPVQTWERGPATEQLPHCKSADGLGPSSRTLCWPQPGAFVRL